MSGPDNMQVIARASTGFDHESILADRRKASRSKGRIEREAALIAEGKPLKPPRKNPAPVAPYSCALWSDGIVEVRCGGDVIAEIPKAAAKCVADFINGLAPKQREAA